MLTADPRDAVLSLKQMSIDFPPGTTAEQARARVADSFGQPPRPWAAAAGPSRRAAQIGAEVVTNDQVRVRDLPPALQQILLALGVGQTTPPFGSLEDGVSVLVLCGRDDPRAGEQPNFDQVCSADRRKPRQRARARYLRDLRRDAVIDYR